ncbi:hypothetical protein [Sediminitomix flava]|uniref:Uncharacterized protein n=1 Tax=Sediminitomix flava TaxID=379075 RepID=A0A315ZJN4_SEDFL|nr:hypothetical protein [Sediminitomix flava]PWJ34111.1 hypothetical protein BC781_11121 [Sediminitomix flava]
MDFEQFYHTIITKHKELAKAYMEGFAVFNELQGAYRGKAIKSHFQWICGMFGGEVEVAVVYMKGIVSELGKMEEIHEEQEQFLAANPDQKKLEDLLEEATELGLSTDEIILRKSISEKIYELEILISSARAQQVARRQRVKKQTLDNLLGQNKYSSDALSQYSASVNEGKAVSQHRPNANNIQMPNELELNNFYDFLCKLDMNESKDAWTLRTFFSTQNKNFRKHKGILVMLMRMNKWQSLDVNIRRAIQQSLQRKTFEELKNLAQNG